MYYVLLLLLTTCTINAQILPFYKSPVAKIAVQFSFRNTLHTEVNWVNNNNFIQNLYDYYTPISDSVMFEIYALDILHAQSELKYVQKAEHNTAFKAGNIVEDSTTGYLYLIGVKKEVNGIFEASPYLCVLTFDSNFTFLSRDDIYMGDSLSLPSICDFDQATGNLTTFGNIFYRPHSSQIQRFNLRTKQLLQTIILENGYANALPNYYWKQNDTMYYLSWHVRMGFDTAFNPVFYDEYNAYLNEKQEPVSILYGKTVRDSSSGDFFMTLYSRRYSFMNGDRVGFFRKDSSLEIIKTIVEFDFSDKVDLINRYGFMSNSIELEGDQVIMSTVINEGSSSTDASCLHVAYFDTTGQVKWSKTFNGERLVSPYISRTPESNHVIFISLVNLDNNLNNADRYYLYLDSLGNLITADTLTLGMSMLPNISVQEHLVLYPNPSQSSLTLANENLYHLAVHIMIYDIQGRVVMSKAFDPIIDISSLPTGTYLYQIEDSGGHRYTSKFQ